MNRSHALAGAGVAIICPTRVGMNRTNGNWDFDELNKPCCPSVYIEGCYANSNKKDAQWWHNNMDAIAMSYADALEAWHENFTT